ncbi:hypothetical protein JQC72_04105 [Polycladomyces sp. WAk]|uniref:General stress protein 17M-like domain-containing protein n=1 Tax=Polycladomyces zharkentensis TaxID=2807616 RepID=A0ABS2WGM0_9BACL|nr:hypothetical protein [Polycladomyces sp. WAk]MBN2908703.1 hypothetical protein [Polycladomyces sp. WAk]
MKEQGILAYFRTEEQANKAAEELKRRGVENVQVDRFSVFPSTEERDLDNPIAEPISSLAQNVMDAYISSPDAGVLAAAHPSASGMADGSRITDEDVLVTAVVDESRLEEMRALLASMGARL